MSSQNSEWRKPTDIMRIHRLKRKSSHNKTAEDGKSGVRSGDDGAPLGCSQESRKRQNPFDCTSLSKRATVNLPDKENSPVSDDDEDIVLSDSESDITKHRLFEVLNTAEQRLLGKAGSGISDLSVLSERNGNSHHRQLPTACSHQDPPLPLDNSLESKTVAQQGSKTEVCERVPVDWSVKIKMRIVTHVPLDTSSQTRSAGEAQAHINFIHNVPLDGVGADGIMAALRRCCHYWVHPHLPWFPEFPRIVPDSKIRKQVPSDVGQNEAIQQALYLDWMTSFTSVFQQLKSGLCPYFYLCCHQFTALFRSSGVEGRPNLTACLTPTTRGIREALKRDGIEFGMPNLKTSGQDRATLSEDSRADPVMDSSHSSQEVLCPTDSEDLTPSSRDVEQSDGAEQDLTATDEGASLWLEDMGLDRKSFPTLEPMKVKIQREGYQQVDHRAESLVFCERCEVQALFNFLINCRSCTALTGPQAGIPPTILSPTSFIGATVRSNKIRHSVAKLSLDGETRDAHVLEISGPLLPHQQLNVAAIVQEVISDMTVISYNTHDPTAAFNMAASVGEEGEGEAVVHGSGGRVWESGLHASVRGQLLKPGALGKGVALREVRCSKDGFTWNL